jgi:hypothetical protein
MVGSYKETFTFENGAKQAWATLILAIGVMANTPKRYMCWDPLCKTSLIDLYTHKAHNPSHGSFGQTQYACDI